MDGPRLWDRRVRAEALRGYPLEDVVRRLGYRRDPTDAARWRRPGSVVSINGFMFYEPCLSGYHPHPLYVVCTHFPE